MNAQKIMAAVGVELGAAQQALGLMEGMIEPTEFESVQELIKCCFYPPSNGHQVMVALNEVLKGFGCETIFDKADFPRAEYVNMGDTYAATVLYDRKKGRFELMSWGDFVEANNL